jgi:hypothetical protein
MLHATASKRGNDAGWDISVAGEPTNDGETTVATICVVLYLLEQQGWTEEYEGWM